jgi:hypothetical protein
LSSRPLYHNVSEKSLFLLVGKKCFSECARAGRELTTITIRELDTSTDALAHWAVRSLMKL